MKKLLLTLKYISIALLLFLVLAVSVNIYSSFLGLPEPLRKKCEGIIQEKGINVKAENIKAGFFRGIVGESIVVWDGEDESRKIAVADRVKLDLNWWQCFTGKFSVKHISITDAAVYCPPQMDAASRKLLQKAVLKASMKEGKLSVDTLSAQVFNCKANISGKVLHLNSLLSDMRNTEMLIKVLSWDSIFKAAPDDFRKHLSVAVNKLEQGRMPFGDSRVTAEFTLNPRDNSENTIEGDFHFGNWTMKNLTVACRGGEFRITPKNCEVRNLSLVLSENNRVSGNIAYDFSDKEISGGLHGSVSPHLLYQAANAEIPFWLAESQFTTNPRFDLTIQPSPLSMKRLKLKGTLEVPGVRFRELAIRNLKTRFKFKDGNLTIRDFAFALDQSGREKISGTLDIAGLNEEPRLSGTVKGRISPETVSILAPNIPPSLETVFTKIECREKFPSFAVKFNNSGLHCREWEGMVSVSGKGFAYKQLRFENVSATFRLRNGQIIAEDKLQLKTKSGMSFSLGKLVVDYIGEKVEAEGCAEFYPALLYNKLGRQYPRNLHRLKLKDKPLHLTFDLIKSPFNPRKWQSDVEIEAEQFIYGGEKIISLTAKGEIDFPKITFSETRIVTGEEGEVHLNNLSYNSHKKEVKASGSAKVNPAVFGAIIDSKTDREKYQNIWKNVECGDEWPKVTVSKLYYSNIKSRQPYLKLEASISGDDVSFRKLHTDKISADIDFTSPGELTISNIVGKDDKKNIKGRANLSWSGIPTLDFYLYGRFDVFEFLSDIGMKGDTVKQLNAGNKTQSVFSGNIAVGQNADQKLKCTMEGDRLQYRKLVFKDYSADWQKVNDNVKWKLTKATLAGGDVQMDGYSQGFFNKQELNIKADRVNLARLLSQLKDRKIEKELGNISTEAQLEIWDRKGSERKRITGSGDIHIREGNLWEAPLLSQLGDIIGLSKLGRISKLDAPVDFRNDHMKVPEFTTNGTILALKGEGKYYWDREDQLDFKVYGQLLKSTSLIPLVLKPVSWFFEAQLEGSFDDYEWSVMGPIKRLWPGNRNDN